MTLTTTHFGVDIPRIGLGTWRLMGETCRDTVGEALRAGYRFIDSAQVYGNENDIGHAIKESGVDRDEIFISTKVWIDDCKPYDLLWSVRESLDRLRVNQVDLLMLHWPNPKVPLSHTIDAMNEARERGLAKHLGMANFTAELFEKASVRSSAPLIANCVEYHPLIDQARVRQGTREQAAALIAYAPLANGEATRHPVIQAIAKDTGRSAGQVVLRWIMQQEDMAALPRPHSKEALHEHLHVFDFELSGEQMKRINALSAANQRIFNPRYAPIWDAVA